MRYGYMLKKLYATLDKYGENFTELKSLKKDIESIDACQHPQVSSLHKLMDIQLLLKDRAYRSYVIRHIHYNFSEEAALFNNGSHLKDDWPYYICIP